MLQVLFEVIGNGLQPARVETLRLRKRFTNFGKSAACKRVFNQDRAKPLEFAFRALIKFGALFRHRHFAPSHSEEAETLSFESIRTQS